MKNVVFAVVAVLVIASGAGAYWYGNQPKITRYPNGEIMTSVERKLFKEDGEYKAYNENGTLSQKFTVADGIRIGQGFIYAGEVTAEVNFSDGILSGPIKFDTKGKSDELDNLQVNVENSLFTVKYSENKKDDKAEQKEESFFNPEITIKGRITCDETEFLDNMQAYLTTQNLNTFNALSKCLSFTESLIDDELYKCEFKGGYQYPKFTDASKFECSAKGDGEQLLDAMITSYGITDMGKVKTFINYSPNDRKFSFNLVDDKDYIKQIHSFKGLEEIITAVVEFTFSKQESQDIVKMASDIMKHLTISDSQTAIKGTVVSDVKGEFNFINGFSNPWTTSFFGVKNTMTSQLKITDKNVLLNIAYPISNKPLFSLGVQIDETFKDKYKSFMELVLKEFSENSEDVASEHLMNKMPEYSLAFSDVIKSVNALLMSNKEEKVLGAVLNVKKGTDLMNVGENPADAFTAKIVSYRNNKPYKVISGDTKNGFFVDDKLIAAENIPDYLDRESLNTVFKQIDDEYREVYKLMQENNYMSDPFIRFFYERYNDSVKIYKDAQVDNQVLDISQNIRKAYENIGNYNGLNNTAILNLKLVPDDMIGDDGKIITSSGEEVEVYPSKALESDDDENYAFIIKINNVPYDVCNVVASTKWESNTGMMVMGVNHSVDDLYTDAVSKEDSEKCTANDILCEAELQTDDAEITQLCKEDGNILYFKFR